VSQIVQIAAQNLPSLNLEHLKVLGGNAGQVKLDENEELHE
jgi:hypothetical protein